MLSTADASHWDVDLDGRDLSGQLLGVEALNTRKTGPEIRLAPEADPTDGLLDIVLIAADDRDLLRTHVEARLAGETPPELQLTAHRGCELTLRAPATAPLHVDDEPWPSGEQRRSDGAVVMRTSAHVPVLAP